MAPPVDEGHYELLRDAIFDRDTARVGELLQRDGVDVDHVDAGGQTLLHLASFWGLLPIVKLLLQAGASLRPRNAAGCTAMDLATHWGHSAVAETLRLRGARSVWEDKLGQLQVQIEDLRLQTVELVKQRDRHRAAHDALLEEFHALHALSAMEKSAHLATQLARQRLQQDHEALALEAQHLRGALQTLQDLQHETVRLQALAQAQREEAERGRDAAMEHRDDALRGLQAAVARQEEVTHHWQQAEHAAAISDSARAIATAQRDVARRRHAAACADLVVATERSHAAERELMAFKMELAEFLFDKERDQRTQLHAARAMQQPGVPSGTGGQMIGHAGGGGGARASVSAHSSTRRRSSQTPTGSKVSSVNTATVAVTCPSALTRACKPSELESNDADPPQLVLARALDAVWKQTFSLAARASGDRVRRRELHGERVRLQTHEHVVRQYQRSLDPQSAWTDADTHGDNNGDGGDHGHGHDRGDNHREGDDAHLHELMVTSLAAFASDRDAKWAALQLERDRQRACARNMVPRGITTAPIVLSRRTTDMAPVRAPTRRQRHAASTAPSTSTAVTEEAATASHEPIRKTAHKKEAVVSATATVTVPATATATATATTTAAATATTTGPVTAATLPRLPSVPAP